MLENKVVVKVISTPQNKWIDAEKKAGLVFGQYTYIHYTCVEPKFTTMDEYLSIPREYTVTFGLKD